MKGRLIAERRSGTRVDTEGAIPIRVSAGVKRGKGLLLDINRTGAFVFTDLALAHDQMVTLKIEVPGADPETLYGVVARRQAGGAGRVPGLGIEFVYKDQLEREQIQDVVQSILAFELLGHDGLANDPGPLSGENDEH